MLENRLLDLQNLVMLGIMLCPGTDLEKSMVYYRLIQEAMQDDIEANDRELNKTFMTAHLLSTKVLTRVRKLSKGIEKDQGSDEEDLNNAKSRVQMESHRARAEVLEGLNKD